MKQFILIAACVLMPFSASAQEATATPAPEAPATTGAPAFAFPVEQLAIGEASAGLMETGRSAGGYAFIARITGRRTNMLSPTRDAWRVSVNYRFLSSDKAIVFQGVCALKSEGRSLLGVQWNQRTAGLYSCAAEGQPEGSYAVEITLPAFREASVSFGGISVAKGADGDEPELQAILRARMAYEGATYEAVPTGFGKEGLMDPRVVEGFLISRDGQPVGRVDFKDRSRDGGVVTAPIAESDGRRAVLFMALHLHAMPDLYSSTERERYLNR